jgi:hypothetical protein
MDGVIAHREVFEIHLDRELFVLGRRKGSRPCVLAVCRFEGNGDGAFRGFSEGGYGEKTNGESGCGKAHRMFLLRVTDGSLTLRCRKLTQGKG